jgi:hypothetical protein
MRKHRILPVAALVVVSAMVAAGCSSSHNPAKSPGAPRSEVQQSAEQDGDAPGIEVDGDADAEQAILNPADAKGTPNRSFTIRGYHARVDLLALPSIGPRKRPWAETPKPHLIESEGETAGTIQTTRPQLATPPLQVNVAGLDFASFGAGHPPDTSGAVGPNNFIQTVNTSIGIFDKTGTRLNAFSFNTFFSQFHTGTPCDNQNGGDPQVIFDRPSNRWIVADLSYPGPYYLCMAVSDGPTITSSPADWTLYPYLASQTQLNDYPKIASGPNGIFVTSNMFVLPSTFVGAQIWAYKRASLGKSTLKAQTVKTSNQYGSLLPANSEAAAATTGPEDLVSLETSTSIGFWQYKVNWKNPSRTTFTQTPKLVTVQSYTPASSVPELGGSSLDSLSDRPMYQLQLSPSDGTLWFNHSVQTSGHAGVRWYQLGNIASGSPTVLQQSTYSPADGLSRWMGSLAVDKNGNMAVGFSTSSSTTHPSIKFATRLAGDPSNQLTSEGPIADGTGSQTGISRWGDYSQMSLDPNNLCTMWYTTEYYLATGGNWQTRIAAFTFPGCS